MPFLRRAASPHADKSQVRQLLRDLKKRLAEIIKRCPCSRAKVPSDCKSNRNLSLKVHRLLEDVEIDCIFAHKDELAQSEINGLTILCAVDRGSGYSVLEILPDKTPEAAAAAFFSGFCTQVGPPRSALFGDMGTEFTAKQFLLTMSSLGIF